MARRAVPYGGMCLQLGEGIVAVPFVIRRIPRKGVSAECAAPGGSRNVPTHSLNARSGADEAKAIVVEWFPFVFKHWRRGSGPSAAELPSTAARPSMRGRPCSGGPLARLPSLPGTLGSPS